MTAHTSRTDQIYDYVVGCAGGVGGRFCQKIVPLCGPSSKLRLARFSARLKFQDGPSVAKRHAENRLSADFGSVIVLWMLQISLEIIACRIRISPQKRCDEL